MDHNKPHQESPTERKYNPLTEAQLQVVVDAVIIVRQVNLLLKKISSTVFAEDLAGMRRQSLDQRVQKRKKELENPIINL